MMAQIPTTQPPTTNPNLPMQSMPPQPAGLSRIYPTAANQTIPIPAGRIVDDSSRGILFWEVSDLSQQPNSHQRTDETLPEGNNWTIPFKVQWLSPVNKTVPFYKVRSMRNPYNKNRFLKIARDGTEIEPTVGRKLVELFHS